MSSSEQLIHFSAGAKTSSSMDLSGSWCSLHVVDMSCTISTASAPDLPDCYSCLWFQGEYIAQHLFFFLFLHPVSKEYFAKGWNMHRQVSLACFTHQVVIEHLQSWFQRLWLASRTNLEVKRGWKAWCSYNVCRSHTEIRDNIGRRLPHTHWGIRCGRTRGGLQWTASCQTRCAHWWPALQPAFQGDWSTEGPAIAEALFASKCPLQSDREVSIHLKLRGSKAWDCLGRGPPDLSQNACFHLAAHWITDTLP